MVLFSLKLLNNLRKAIAGRRFPHQLAGGVALGVLLGIIPHGNLLALFVLVGVLCFRVNHALMAVIAILVSFSATRLDSYSHTVGEYLLTHPIGNQVATQAWALPVVPWTDLNNTVVLGSFVIGLGSILPVFFATLPIFRLIAPAETDESLQGESEDATESSAGNLAPRMDEAHHGQGPRHLVAEPVSSSASDDVFGTSSGSPTNGKHSVSLFVDQQEEVPSPRFAATSNPSPTNTVSDESSASPSQEQMVSVETRIDVIRMKDFRKDESAEQSNDGRTGNDTEQPMDEALNYLLRQLRHSQERKAAG